MDQQIEKWDAWLNGIPAEELPHLGAALHRRGQNGKATVGSAPAEPRVTRTPTNDLYVEEMPAYLDIFNLHTVYQKLAFESNLIVKGPKGDGKTLSVFAFAHVNKIPLVIQECSEDTKKYELMGSQMMVGDETVYVLGSVPTAIDVANEVGQCILLLEELNALTPQVQKQLNAVSDFRQMVSMPHIKKTYKLRKGAKIWLVATLNPTLYGGTYDLNEDLKSRFEEIELHYPAPGQEKQVLKAACGAAGAALDVSLDPNSKTTMLDHIISLAKETRQGQTTYSLSTRDLVRLVNTIAKIGLDTSLQMILGKFEDTDKDIVMKAMTRVFGPKPLRKFWGALS